MKAFIFPGQGAQYVGMGKDLYDSFSASKNVFQKADSILQTSISGLCFEGPIEQLTQTIYCQPAIFTVSIAALEAYKSAISYQPQAISYMAGLSLGEYTALVAAGALSFEDGLKLVAARAQFMQEAAEINHGKMASVLGLDLDKIKQVVDQAGVEIANLNCPGQVVLSGPPEAIEKIKDIAIGAGARKVIILDVSGAFHSSLMQSAAQHLKQKLQNTIIKKPIIKVVNNVLASADDDPEHIKDNLVTQLTGSVLWEKAVRFMISKGANEFFEIGPGKVLKGLMRKIDPLVKVVTIEKKEDIVSLLH